MCGCVDTGALGLVSCEPTSGALSSPTPVVRRTQTLPWCRRQSYPAVQGCKEGPAHGMPLLPFPRTHVCTHVSPCPECSSPYVACLAHVVQTMHHPCTIHASRACDLSAPQPSPTVLGAVVSMAGGGPHSSRCPFSEHPSAHPGLVSMAALLLRPHLGNCGPGN